MEIDVVKESRLEILALNSHWTIK